MFGKKNRVSAKAAAALSRAEAALTYVDDAQAAVAGARANVVTVATAAQERLTAAITRHDVAEEAAELRRKADRDELTAEGEATLEGLELAITDQEADLADLLAKLATKQKAQRKAAQGAIDKARATLEQLKAFRDKLNGK